MAKVRFDSWWGLIAAEEWVIRRKHVVGYGAGHRCPSGIAITPMMSGVSAWIEMDDLPILIVSYAIQGYSK